MKISTIKKQKLTLKEINEVITPKLREEAITHLKSLGVKDEELTETLIVDHMKNRLALYIK